MAWVIEVKQNLKKIANSSKVESSTEKELWQKRSIYKIPTCMTEQNKKAYEPQMVSFGPYHHGKAHLMPMEEHKQRALLHLFKRSCNMELVIDSLAAVIQLLKDSYDSLDPMWENDSKFLQLMILDGCFMFEILHTAANDSAASGIFKDYAENDPIFSYHGREYLIPFIMRDMLMLENQLPMLVLQMLANAQPTIHKDEESLVKLILAFFYRDTSVALSGKRLHLLDVYRKSLLKEISSSPGSDNGYRVNTIPSATDLHAANVRFKRSETQSLNDIKFNNGVLRLPRIVAHGGTESLFLNLIAFERLHSGVGNEVASYIFLMDDIIQNEKDVAFLCAKGIIRNAIGSDEAVFNLFKSVSTDLTLDDKSAINEIYSNVGQHCNKTWNVWRANIVLTYFSNATTIWSLFAAALFFSLTLIQTLYTIYPYYHPN